MPYIMISVSGYENKQNRYLSNQANKGERSWVY